jgi:C4-dicarboxylate-specific signal transduction histidine kinase
MNGATTAAAERAEAARYALLRRLAPAMRHHLVVNLQPIGMVYELMDHRLRAGEPDLAHVQAGAHKIHRFAKAALHSCLDVVAWLAPDEPVSTACDSGVEECLALLASSLAFAGYAVRTNVQPTSGEVSRGALRHVLTAALVHCTDAVPAPAELDLQSAAGPPGLQVTVRVRALPGAAGAAGTAIAPSYRPLAWSDVEALARVEGVTALRTDDGVVITFPWTHAPRALTAS